MRYYKTELSHDNPYYISKHRFCELRHYCMQYNEWKKALNDISLIREMSLDDINSGCLPDIVPDIVEKRERYLKNIELVEKCCKRTDEFFWEYILLGVTTDVGYDNLRLMHNIACCRNKYYQMYRKFFYILSGFR